MDRCVIVALICASVLHSAVTRRNAASQLVKSSAVDEPLELNTNLLVIDTDAGADDAGAILLALSANLNVVGITCVNGNTGVDNVAVNVLKTLKTANRLDIPVYKGASNSIVWTPPSDYYFGNDGFGDFEFPDPPDQNVFLQKEHAVNALVRTVSENPGEVTLLCLGPLTNIALAIRMDSTFLTKLDRLVVMGGSVEGVGNVKPNVEFNFYSDPVAAHIVFNSTDTRTSGIKPIVLLPWESVLLRNIIPLSWRRDVLGNLMSPAVQLLNKAERYQLQEPIEDWGCSDCLAAAVIADPMLVLNYTSQYAYVISEGDLASGAVFVDYMNTTDMPPNVVIIKTVDTDRFMQLLLIDIGEEEISTNVNANKITL